MHCFCSKAGNACVIRGLFAISTAGTAKNDVESSFNVLTWGASHPPGRRPFHCNHLRWTLARLTLRLLLNRRA